jgi:two-component sensor histidine kinase
MLNKLLALHAWPFWLRLGVAGFAVGASYAFQIPLEREIPGEPFLLFFIVVIASTLAFGELLGLLACAASTVLSVNFFEPLESFTVYRAADLIKIEMYAVMCALSILGVARLRSAVALIYRAMVSNEKKSALLFEEMAHRTSNSFAVVAALIRSKASAVAEPEAKSILDEAVEQVVIMARLHRNLCAANGVLAVDSASFLAEVTSDLKNAMAAGRPIAIASKAGRFSLPVTQAMPLGLIVNELVTNALKHAFPDNRPGDIRVTLEEQPANELVLTVEDNGIGMHGQELRRGMGQTLVAGLAELLDGHLQYRSDDRGTSFYLTFPYEVARAPSDVSQSVH